MHASQRRIYYAVQAGCFHSYQPAGDCGRRECGGIDRTCPDQEDEISQGPDMGLCGNRNRFAGGGICACKDKLWSKTFLDGNPAFRGDKDYICVLYGGIAEKRC